MINKKSVFKSIINPKKIYYREILLRSKIKRGKFLF